MMPSLDFVVLSIGKNNGKRNELLGPNQVEEGFSKRFFQNFSFGGQVGEAMRCGTFGGNDASLRFRPGNQGILSGPSFPSDPGSDRKETHRESLPRARQSR